MASRGLLGQDFCVYFIRVDTSMNNRKIQGSAKRVLQHRKLRLILSASGRLHYNLRGTYGLQSAKYDDLSAFF